MKLTSLLLMLIIVWVTPVLPSNDHAHTRGYEKQAESHTFLEQLDKIDAARQQLTEKLSIAMERDEVQQGLAPRNLQLCDECGTQGSCKRKTKLGVYFTVTVEDSRPGGLFTVTCEYPNPVAPNCYYTVNGTNAWFDLYHETDGLMDALAEHGNCANFAYRRASRSTSKGYTDRYCDTPSLCFMIERVCRFVSTTRRSFQCPVGTFMTISGGLGPTNLTVNNDTVIVDAGDNCVINRKINKVTCRESDGFSMVATIAADDCDCVTCGAKGIVQVHECSNPIPTWIFHSGVCAPNPAETNYCKPGFIRAEKNEAMLNLIGGLRASLRRVRQEVLLHAKDDAAYFLPKIDAIGTDLKLLEAKIRSN